MLCQLLHHQVAINILQWTHRVKPECHLQSKVVMKLATRIIRWWSHRNCLCRHLLTYQSCTSVHHVCPQSSLYRIKQNHSVNVFPFFFKPIVLLLFVCLFVFCIMLDTKRVERVTKTTNYCNLTEYDTPCCELRMTPPLFCDKNSSNEIHKCIFALSWAP